MTLLFVWIIGFFAGALIPVIASRFGKVLPADPGTVLATLWHKPHFPKRKSGYRYELLCYKWRKLMIYSVCWGLVMGALFLCSDVFIGSASIFWIGSLLWAIGLSMAIDDQYYLLPDFITVPLLFCGFGFSLFGGLITPISSFGGAVFGYLLCTAAVFMTRLFRKTEFGAGDVKMVTALGAWLGYIGLNCTLVLSFLFFAVWSLVKKRKTGAFGPALGLAAVIMLFCLYAK